MLSVGYIGLQHTGQPATGKQKIPEATTSNQLPSHGTQNMPESIKTNRPATLSDFIDFFIIRNSPLGGMGVRDISIGDFYAMPVLAVVDRCPTLFGYFIFLYDFFVT